MLIDTHCHLDATEFDADRAEVVAHARAAGVSCVVIPAVERANFGVVRDLAHATPGAVYALGIHPMYVARAADDDLDALRTAVRAAIDDPAFVAIGEIGLDFFDPDAIAASDRQQAFYRAQLEIAAEFELPVLLHVRRSQDQLLKQLRRVRVVGGCAHAFNGSFEQAQAFVELGFKLGMGGAMTYERALQIRRLATQMPLDALVLETDAPDIAPAWIKGRRNAPAELPRVAAVLGQLRGLDAVEIAHATTRNACMAMPRLAALIGDSITP